MRRIKPRGCVAADRRDELAPLIKKTRSHGTIAKGAGLAKRPRSAKGLPFSSSRFGRKPVGNSFDDLVGAQQEFAADSQSERARCLEIDDELNLTRLLDR